tara:strand:- start:42 stop:536 length:495 start_codon:yes stop_codon:yes gene_type:complete
MAVKWNLLKSGKNKIKVTLDRFIWDHQGAVRTVFHEYSIRTTRTAQINAPTTTGALRNSMFPFTRFKARGNKRIFQGGVASNKIYAKAMEEGMRPANVPYYNLVDWARMKGAENPYAMAFSVKRRISRQGLPKRDFMKKALIRHKDWLKRKLSVIIEKAWKERY